MYWTGSKLMLFMYFFISSFYFNLCS